MATRPMHPTRKLRGGSLDMSWEVTVRKKIAGSDVVNRLIAFVKGEIKLEPAQITAALGLLRKVLPDLASVDHTIEDKRETVVRVPEPARDLTTWQQQHVPDKPTIQ